MDRIVMFNDWPCRLEFSRYAQGGGTAIRLVHAGDGDVVAVATVNLPNVQLEPGEIIIKDYSENAGMLRTLVEAGVVNDTRKRVSSGFATMPICRLLVGTGDTDA